MLPVSTLQQISPAHYTTSDTQQSDYEDFGGDDFTYDDAFLDDNQPGTSYQRPGKTSKTNRPNLNAEQVLTFTNLDITFSDNNADGTNIADDSNTASAMTQQATSAPPAHNPALLTFQQGRQMLRDHMLSKHLAAERLLEGALSTTC